MSNIAVNRAFFIKVRVPPTNSKETRLVAHLHGEIRLIRDLYFEKLYIWSNLWCNLIIILRFARENQVWGLLVSNRAHPQIGRAILRMRAVRGPQAPAL